MKITVKQFVKDEDKYTDLLTDEDGNPFRVIKNNVFVRSVITGREILAVYRYGDGYEVMYVPKGRPSEARTAIADGEVYLEVVVSEAI